VRGNCLPPRGMQGRPSHPIFVGVRPPGRPDRPRLLAQLDPLTRRAEHSATPPRVHGLGSACCSPRPRICTPPRAGCTSSRPSSRDGRSTPQRRLGCTGSTPPAAHRAHGDGPRPNWPCLPASRSVKRLKRLRRPTSSSLRERHKYHLVISASYGMQRCSMVRSLQQFAALEPPPKASF
jgi:hypothetical protein